MAVPKRRTSRTRRDKRRTHDRISLPHLVVCPTTGVHHLPHRAFWHEDKLYYKGKVMMTKTPKKKKKAKK